jgi:hypothetical protein
MLKTCGGAFESWGEMSRLFYGNFDFETELRDGRRTDDQPSGRIARGLRGAWLALAEPGDWVVGPDEQLCQVEHADAGLVGVRRAPEKRPERMTELVPWGWSSAVLIATKGWGLRVAAPPLEAVRLVNRRSFRASVEQQFDIAQEGLVLCTSLADVALSLQSITPRGLRYDWVIKAEFGMAGRQAWRGSGPTLSPQGVGWLAHRLKESGCVVVEPWLEAVTEGSLQFDIPLEGPPRLRGISSQVVDATGVYRASQVSPASFARFAAAIPAGERIAERVQVEGYCGPLGLDVMWYRSAEGDERLRLLQDLNARMTMGYLAVAAAERVGTAIEWSPRSSATELVGPEVTRLGEGV